MRITNEKQNVIFRTQQLHQIQAPAAVHEQKYAAVVLVVVERPLKAFYAQHRHEGKDNLIISKERLKDFRGTEGVNIEICEHYHTLSDEQLVEVRSQVLHEHINRLVRLLNAYFSVTE